jgi:hypothetical protein
MNSKVLLKTSQQPEGPWSEPQTLYQATPITDGSSTYAPIPHPYYDPTGRTLVVTFTNHPNRIQAVKIVSHFPLERPLSIISLSASSKAL